MTVFMVTYRVNDYSTDERSVHVVASNICRAVEFISKRKYLGCSGYVKEAVTAVNTVVVAK